MFHRCFHWVLLFQIANICQTPKIQPIIGRMKIRRRAIGCQLKFPEAFQFLSKKGETKVPRIPWEIMLRIKSTRAVLFETSTLADEQNGRTSSASFHTP